MGTNYYLKEDVCEKCGRAHNRIHIGKSSMGWCFGLHVDPDLNINSLDDWKRLFELPANAIEDEYHRVVPAKEMLEIITNRDGKRRQPVDGRFCVANAEGSYDLIRGEFS